MAVIYPILSLCVLQRRPFHNKNYHINKHPYYSYAILVPTQNFAVHENNGFSLNMSFIPFKYYVIGG